MKQFKAVIFPGSFARSPQESLDFRPANRLFTQRSHFSNPRSTPLPAIQRQQECTRFSGFTVDQAKALLNNAGIFGLMPYIAIGLFAGLRSAELIRSEASAIDLNNRVVVVSALVAKKRSRRVVEMCDALVAWLGTCNFGTDQLVDSETFPENMAKLRTAAGIVNWPPNGLRHSFGSYHLSFHGDAMKTAALMGHKDPSILHNHYKALVLKTEAERYWNLRPGMVVKVVESDRERDSSWRLSSTAVYPPCPRTRWDNLDACNPGHGGYTASGSAKLTCDLL